MPTALSTNHSMDHLHSDRSDNLVIERKDECLSEENFIEIVNIVINENLV